MFYTDLHYVGPGFTGRGWISFRDPFLLRHEQQDWLLLCARVVGGQVSRRGCVGLVRHSAEGYQLKPPLFFPRMYDDVECPCLVEREGTFYLIGSIREDMEVHYWWCETFRGEYRAFSNNVLMPKGNYAARVMRDGANVLVYTFYIDGLNVESGARSLPPPKQLRRRSDGKLERVSFHRWAEKGRGAAVLQKDRFRTCLDNPTAIPDRRYRLQLIRWGSYIELSVNRVVRLSLVDARFSGRRLGIFLESAEITLSALSLRFLEPPAHDQA